MKFAFSGTLDALQLMLGKLFSRIPFDSGQAFEFKFYSTDLPLVATPKLTGPVRHVIRTYLRNETDDTPPSGGEIYWYPDGGQIRITDISGISSGKLYTLRFIALA